MESTGCATALSGELSILAEVLYAMPSSAVLDSLGSGLCRRHDAYPFGGKGRIALGRGRRGGVAQGPDAGGDKDRQSVGHPEQVR
jgi:hypothetical protein